LAALKTEKYIFLLYKTSYLNEEGNCSVPSPSGKDSWAKCYKTNCNVILLGKMGFFIQKSKFSKFHYYRNFILKMSVK
jgi:hypothetical protein